MIFLFVFLSLGAFRLYDVDNDGYITRDEMYNIVEAIYQMVVRITTLHFIPYTNVFHSIYQALFLYTYFHTV